MMTIFNFREWLMIENTVTQILKDGKTFPPEYVAQVQQQVRMTLGGTHWAVGLGDKLIPFMKWCVFIVCTAMKEMSKEQPLDRPNLGLVDNIVRRNIIHGNDDFIARTLRDQPDIARSKFNNAAYTIQNLKQDNEAWHEKLKLQKRKSAAPGTKLDIPGMPPGYYWVSLDEGYCEKEGNAMGHCGNANHKEGDNIYSLRDSQGVPHLTFIINNGKLGESKGYGNQKPDKKYHPHIVALLLATEMRTHSSAVAPSPYPIIEFIKGGGYLPENNFHFDDLSPEMKQKVLAKKPYINDYLKYLKEVVAGGNMMRFHEELNKAFNFKFKAIEGDNVVVVQFDDMMNMVSWLKDNTKSDMDGVPNFDDFPMMDYNVSSSEARDTFKYEANEENKARVKEIIDKIWETVKDQYDEEQVDLDLDEAMGENEDLRNALRWAAEDGWRVGGESDAWKSVKRSLSGERDESGNFYIKLDGDHVWKIMSSMQDLGKVFMEKGDPEDWQSDYEDLPNQIEFKYSEPGDYSGFDEDAYNERLSELLGEVDV